MTTVQVRTATAADSEAVAAIYDYHARNGTASFDLEGPDPQFWAEKISGIIDRDWPFLIAEADGAVAAYAYATQFRDRPAYVHACEDSIYVAPGRLGEGIGSVLLKALKSAAAEAGFDEMIAVIGGGEPASVALHRKCGFEERGRLSQVGFKFGRRLDSVYMQCALGSGAD
jgi:phosphinothricin acetyltransferase